MRPILPLVLLATLFIAPGAYARQVVTDPNQPRELPGDGPVSVQWTDPAEFSDLRFSGSRWDAERGDWVADLARHVQHRAGTRLPPGQTMDVTITDIQRAGGFEPWLGPNYSHVRMMRDIYPPRMTLQVRITGADGQVLAEGERSLSNLNYLRSSPPSLNSNDSLRHEKRMIDDWLRRELPLDPGAAQAAR